MKKTMMRMRMRMRIRMRIKANLLHVVRLPLPMGGTGLHLDTVTVVQAQAPPRTLAPAPAPGRPQRGAAGLDPPASRHPRQPSVPHPLAPGGPAGRLPQRKPGLLSRSAMRTWALSLLRRLSSRLSCDVALARGEWRHGASWEGGGEGEC